MKPLKMYITQMKNVELGWASNSAVENSHWFPGISLSIEDSELLIATLLPGCRLLVNFVDFPFLT